MRIGIIPEFANAAMAVEDRLHDAALNAAAAPVHEAHFAKAGEHGRFEKLLDDRWNVLRRKRV